MIVENRKYIKSHWLVLLFALMQLSCANFIEIPAGDIERKSEVVILCTLSPEFDTTFAYIGYSLPLKNYDNNDIVKPEVLSLSIIDEFDSERKLISYHNSLGIYYLPSRLFRPTPGKTYELVLELADDVIRANTYVPDTIIKWNEFKRSPIKEEQQQANQNLTINYVSVSGSFDTDPKGKYNVHVGSYGGFFIDGSDTIYTSDIFDSDSDNAVHLAHGNHHEFTFSHIMVSATQTTDTAIIEYKFPDRWNFSLITANNYFDDYLAGRYSGSGYSNTGIEELLISLNNPMVVNAADNIVGGMGWFTAIRVHTQTVNLTAQ